MPLQELDPSDVEPSWNTDDTEPARCAADGCMNSVVKPARGKTPKFCPEHKTTTANKTTRSWAKAGEVETLLGTYLDGLSFVVSMANPVDGQIIAVGGKAVAHEVVELAKTDKKLRDVLETMTKPGKYGPLILTAVTTVIVPIMANHNLLPQFIIGEAPVTDINEGRTAA